MQHLRLRQFLLFVLLFFFSDCQETTVKEDNTTIDDLIKKKGKGAIGICAGAYALSETPNYPGFVLNGAEAIDIEHDARGCSLVIFSLTEAGKRCFPNLRIVCKQCSVKKLTRNLI